MLGHVQFNQNSFTQSPLFLITSIRKSKPCCKYKIFFVVCFGPFSVGFNGILLVTAHTTSQLTEPSTLPIDKLNQYVKQLVNNNKSHKPF